MIVASCFSQTTYPKKINIGQDTVIALTVDQMKKINTDIVLLEKLKTEVGILSSAIEQKDSTIFNLKLTYYNCLKIDSVSSLQFIKMNEIISLQDEKYEQMKLAYRQENSLLKKDLRKTNLKLVLTNVSILLTGLLTVGLLVK